MLQFPLMFTNWFQRSDITAERLLVFAIDTRNRLMAHNPGGVYDTIIANLLTVINALSDDIDAKGIEIGDRKGTAQD